MTIQFLRGTRASWLASAVVLAAGQPGIATDTGDLRVGDGVRTWVNLPDPKVAKGALIFNVRDQGAVGNWSTGTTGTDDLAAINATLTLAAAVVAAGVSAARVLVPWTTGNGYRFTDTITTPAGVEWDIRAPLVYTGPTGRAALVVGGSSAQYNRHHTIRLKRYTLTDWTSESDAGLVIRNHYTSTFDIRQCSNFTVGVTCIGDTSVGFSYNQVHLGELLDNQTALDLTNDTNGWCNENSFFGGRFSCSSGTYTSLDRVGVRITSRDTGPYYNNANTFYSPSFELKGALIAGVGTCLLVEYGTANEVVKGRHEGNSAGVLVQQNASTDNWIDFQYSDEAANAPVMDASGTSASGGITRKYTSMVDRSMRVIYKADQIHLKACYYDGATSVNVPGLTVGTSATGNTDARAVSSLVLAATYLEIPSTRYVGFYMSTRTLKRFAVNRDAEAGFGGRIIIRAYDNTGTILSAAGTVQTAKPAANPTYSTSFGGAWLLGNDSNASYSFGVSTATDYVFIGIRGGTAVARLRTLSVSTLEPVNPATWLAFPDNGENYGTAAPTAGTWTVGRMIRHAVPTPSSNTGWVCTTAGTPGTWRTFGEPASASPGQQEFMSTLGHHPSAAYFGASTQTISTANQAILVRFIPFRDIAVSELHWFTAATSSGNYDIGIYTLAGTRLWSKGSTAWPAVSTAAAETVTGVTLTAGTQYYFALASDATTGTFRGSVESVTDQIKMLDGTYFAKVVASSFPLPSTITPGNSRSTKAPLITVHGT